MRKIRVLACLLLLAGPARAECDHWSRWDSIHVDQDLFAPGNEDRNYTMGLRFVWNGQAAESKCTYQFIAPFKDKFDGLTGMTTNASTLTSFAMGNSAFTPDDLRSSAVVADDRPYSSLLYASSQSITETTSGRAAQGSKFVLGVLGLPISEVGQTAIHVVHRAGFGGETPYDPQGWHNQIRDGGDITGMYQRSLFGRIALPWRYVDAAHSLDASIGYYSGVSYGLVAKFGGFEKERVDVPFWTMITELDPQNDADQLVSERDDSDLPGYTITEWYFLIGGRVRWVGYNQLLQGGGFFNSSAHKLSGDEIESVVEEVSVGLNLTFTRKRRLMFTCTQRSPEHRLAQARSHRWCGINYYRPLR